MTSIRSLLREETDWRNIWVIAYRPLLELGPHLEHSLRPLSREEVLCLLVVWSRFEGLTDTTFISWKARSCSSPHLKFLFFLSTSKKGLYLSEDLEMNWFKVASRPVSLCTSLTHCGDLSLAIAFTWSGLASIPLWLTMYPRNFPDDTLKLHLVGFGFIQYLRSMSKASCKLATWSVLNFDFTSMSSI